TDQPTDYTYGVPKGASAGQSNIASNSLLYTIAYPDSSGGSDVATFAYNAQGQEMWKQDQAGNIIQTDYDVAGRVTHKRATTIDADFDNYIARITFAYDSSGRTQTVTQY